MSLKGPHKRSCISAITVSRRVSKGRLRDVAQLCYAVITVIPYGKSGSLEICTECPQWVESRVFGHPWAGDIGRSPCLQAAAPRAIHRASLGWHSDIRETVCQHVF